MIEPAQVDCADVGESGRTEIDSAESLLGMPCSCVIPRADDEKLIFRGMRGLAHLFKRKECARCGPVVPPSDVKHGYVDFVV